MTVEVDVAGRARKGRASEDEQATILYADIDPERARDKHIVKIPKLYELHRTADRRPQMYQPVCAPVARESRS